MLHEGLEGTDAEVRDWLRDHTTLAGGRPPDRPELRPVKTPHGRVALSRVVGDGGGLKSNRSRMPYLCPPGRLLGGVGRAVAI